jgi:chemotaxis response regulator CheB
MNGTSPSAHEPTPVNTVKVVIGVMQSMLMRIVKDVIAADINTQVVAESVPVAALPDVIRALNPDVVVLGGELGADLTDSAFETLLRRDARPLRIISLSDGGRRTQVHELRAHVVDIDQLSAQSLLSAITGDPNPEAHQDG